VTASSLTKNLLGKLPFTAELYQSHIAAGKHASIGYSLERLRHELPVWVEAADKARENTAVSHSPVLVIGYLRWWLEYTVALSVLLYGLGHEVHLGFLPYRRWNEPVTEFDRRRQVLYLRQCLQSLRNHIGVHDLSKRSSMQLDSDLRAALREQSRRDMQYILQREDLDPRENAEHNRLYALRVIRNETGAKCASAILQRHHVRHVIIPNGSILEFGSIYQTAQSLGIPTVTFEFGEQRERLWLSQNAEVMKQDTSALWQAKGRLGLSDQEELKLQELYRARRGASAWDRFKRKWQSAETIGPEAIREQFGLAESSKLALVCTNVVGDSLALDRQTFTSGMSDWLTATVQHLSAKPDVHTVVRVHPGELLGAGHPSAEIVRSALPELPENVTVVEPDSQINTYDLIDLADIGLVFTTTVGLEMAMHGLPVVVAGKTHYRGKGFTHDPKNSTEYLAVIDDLLENSRESKLSQYQQEAAWHYAYLFFFEYPFPFPWHIVDFWEDVQRVSPAELLQPHAIQHYMETVRALLGEPVDWEASHA
jgi:hypothetical protein